MIQEWLMNLLPEQASSMAWAVDGLMLLLVATAAFFTALIFTLVVVFTVRYRRNHATEQPVQIHGHLGLEIFWSAVPTVIVLIFFGLGAWVYIIQNTAPTGGFEVSVVGKQWMWKFQHPDGKREINELHVPLGQKVHLLMTSEDVIHSFFVPAFRIKNDVIPGRYTQLWFEATKVGAYHLFCAEYCGTQHSGMIGKIVVMEPAEYQRWLGSEIAASGGVKTPQEEGRLLAEKNACLTCHATGRAPAFPGIYGSTVQFENGIQAVVDDAYIRESILDPTARLVAGYQPLMPTYTGQLSEEEIMRIISYIKSLKNVPDAANAPVAGGAR